MNIEIAEFIETLVKCKLLLCIGEANVIALIAHRKYPDYGFMRDVVATRAAHKKYGPTEESGVKQDDRF